MYYFLEVKFVDKISSDFKLMIYCKSYLLGKTTRVKYKTQHGSSFQKEEIV